MSSGRGAKGSIKDRIISLLYRLRYQDKKIKEEDYTVENKQKQINYQRHLKEFKETEKIDILSNSEKKELEKVKLNAKVSLQEKNNKELKLDIVDIELQQQENKNSSLDNKVDLKKEIKKTEEEIVILKEVSNFVSDSIKNIDSIKEEVEELKEKSKEQNKPTEDLEQKYKSLKDKINKLKLQYDSVMDKYDLSEFRILESIKLIDNIENYKSLATLNEIDMMLKVCKKEIKKIESITIISKEEKTIKHNINNTKNNQSIVKIKFNKQKEKLKELDSIKNNIDLELKKQKEIIDEMYSKASYFDKKYKKRIEYKKIGNLFPSFTRIAIGLLTLPLTGKSLFGIALGHTMINKGLKNINKSIIKKEKIVVDYDYEDISNKIYEVKDKLEYTNLILTDSLNEIKKIKENIKNTYSKYDNILPEYKYVINNINELENKILLQQQKMNKMNNKLEEENEINKQKLKRIEK